MVVGVYKNFVVAYICIVFMHAPFQNWIISLDYEPDCYKLLFVLTYYILYSE